MPACSEEVSVQRPTTDHQQINYDPHRSSQLFLLRLWTERSDESHRPEDLAGKLQDPVSGQVQYFSGELELVRILHRTIRREETAGPAAQAASGQTGCRAAAAQAASSQAGCRAAVSENR